MLPIFRNNFLPNLLVLILVQVCLSDDTIEVNLKQGILSGKVDTTFLKTHKYHVFKGIPYAEPPVNELRFQPPRNGKKWEGTYEAYYTKPTCPQFNSRMRNNEPFGISGSEDCLYINVFTPLPEGKYPVVVFDYNDNFITGFNGTDTYSPEFFIEEEVIVVTITHRLGLFGYLTTEDEVIPSNNGLKDFILGLEWVRDNIEKFGGDKTRVTLMGNRGGAALVNMLLYSPKAKGLFSSVIIQSGTTLEPIYFHDNPRQKAFELGEVFDIKTNDSAILLQELQKVDIEPLMSKEVKVIDGSSLEARQMSVYPFSPTIETDHKDAILTFMPEKGKIVNDVPILIGFNSREGLDIASHFIFEPKLVAEASREFHFPIRPDFRFDRNSSIIKEAFQEIDNFYLTDGHLNVHNILEYATLIGDTLQNYALDYAVKKLAREVESPVFYYMFDLRGALNENSENLARKTRFSLKHWGATITDELCYLHICSRIRKTYEQLKKLPSEQVEMKVLKKMVRLWTNFAKMRNPTPQEDDMLKNFKWLAVDIHSKETKYLHINKYLKMKVDPLGERAQFWDQFLDKYSKMAIDGVVRDKEHDEL